MNDDFDNERADKAALEEFSLNTARRLGIREMIQQLGDNPDREGLKDTPHRVIKAWREMCAGYSMKPESLLTTFDGEGYNEMICVGPVSFYSTCEHHLLPFFGSAWVAYVPGDPQYIHNDTACKVAHNRYMHECSDDECEYIERREGKIIGLSKLPRLVEIFSRRLQNQERLTSQIADTLMELLNPRGAACLIRAQHFCMMARGVRQQTASMTTSVLRGAFFNQPQTRAEFLALSQR